MNGHIPCAGISWRTRAWLVASLFTLLFADLAHSHGLKLGLVVVAVPVLVVTLTTTFRRLDFSSPRLLNGSTRQLAWIRILVTSTALILTLIDDVPATSHFPVGFRANTKIFHVFNAIPGYTTLLGSAHLLAILQGATALLLLLGAVGWRTRWTLLLATPGYVVIQVILRQYTHSFHTGIVPLYLLLLLPWTPCAAVWSLDRRLAPARPAPAPQCVGFSVYACYTVVAVVYVLCGLSKLSNSGLVWFRPQCIQYILMESAMNPACLDYTWKASLCLARHHVPGFVYGAIGVVGVGAELGYVTVLFSRRAQLFVPVVTVGLHLGILVLQNIAFLDMILLQFMFANADRMADMIPRLLRRVRSRPDGAPELSGNQRAGPQWACGVMALVVAGLLSAWIFRVEYYPVSSWQMYSDHHKKSVADYYQMRVILEDGRSLVVSKNDYSPSVWPNSRDTLKRAFDRKQVHAFEEFTSAFIERCNSNHTYHCRVCALDVQLLGWDYGGSPGDRSFGGVARSHRYDGTISPVTP